MRNKLNTELNMLIKRKFELNNKKDILKYNIENMSKVSDKMDYDMAFKLVKKDKKWVLQTPDRVTLEKIPVLHNYVND